MRTFHTITILITASLLWVAVSCVGTTGAHRVEFETRVVGVGGFGPFENVPPSGAEPWTVTLQEARVALGPVYLFEGEPLLTKVYHQLLMPRAFAHPGHYQEGEALGEILEQRVVDLLDPDSSLLGLMNAVTGDCHSAQVGLGTAEDELDDAPMLEGHSLLIRGEASQGDSVVPFEGWLDLDIYVEGLDFEQTIDDSTGHLLVEVDLQRWLRRVDFATLTPGEPATFGEETQAHNALNRGVDNTLAYQLRWVEEEE